MLKPYSGSTFAVYAANVFISYLQNQLEDKERLDLVWDRYSEDSLKKRKKREGTSTTSVKHYKTPQ